MTTAIRSGQVTDNSAAAIPVPGASIYVYNLDGTAAALTSDGVTPITQPLTTDQFGNYTYQALVGYYREDTWYAGKLRFREDNIALGSPGADLALRSDLALSSGSSLVNVIQTGTGAVSRTVQARLGDVVSVKDFGATGDGATDDGAAINLGDAAAKLAGKSLYFPAGTYVVAPNVVNGSTSWFGAGRDVSIIKAKAVAFGNLTGAVLFQSKNDFTVQDLGFDMSAATFSSGVAWALQAQLCNRWAFTRCKVIGIQAHVLGLAVDGGSNFSITHNYFRMPTPTGTATNQACNISFASGLPSNYTFSHNTLDGSGFFTNGANGIVSFNVVENWKFGGGLTFGPNVGCVNHNIIGNTITGVPTVQDVNAAWPSGIECWSPYSVINGNFIQNCPGDGIGTGGLAMTIVGNKCVNNGRGDGTTTAVGSGITINSVTISAVNYEGSQSLVASNTCVDTQGTPTQKYGIAEFVTTGPAMTAVDYNNNRISGSVTAKQIFTSGQRSFKGAQLFQQSTCTVPSLAAAASYDEVIVLAGVRQGDKAEWGFSGDSRGYSIIAHTTTDNVILTVTNVSGSTKAAPVSQTWTLWVEKAPTSAGY